MLTLLIPEQISKFWDVIKYAVEQSLPPISGEHPDKINHILSAALSGKVNVWVSHKDRKFEAIVLTTSMYDVISDTRNLLIYCLYGYNKIDRNSWLEGLIALSKYAKSRKFNQITAYTDVDHIINMAKHLGGEARYTFISFDVDLFVQNLNKLIEERNEDNN